MAKMSNINFKSMFNKKNEAFCKSWEVLKNAFERRVVEMIKGINRLTY